MAEAVAVAVYSFVQWVGSTATALGASATTAAAAEAAAVAAIDAGIKVALMASASAIIANNNKPEAQGNLVNMAISPNEPRRLIIGRRQTGGVMLDWQIKGSKNQNLFQVIYLSEGQCGPLRKIFAGGREVYSSTINHGVRTTIPNFRSGGDRLWVTYYDGRAGQTADAYMQAQFPGVWTANHKGTGCAYVIVESQWDSDNLTSPPAMNFEMDGAYLYDRRLDSTAGGSGSHRLTDSSTWAPSTNPAVAVDHYMLGRYLGAIKTFGIGIDPADAPYADFASLANLCDENVTLKAGGTQKRYEANGFLFADRSFKDTIKDLCRAMACRPADHGGRIGFIDSMPKTPVMELTDQDLMTGTSDQYRPKSSWSDLATGVQGTYIDTRQNFQPVDYPAVLNAAWDAEDNGQPKIEVVDFEMETNQERAERLATLHILLKRRQARLTGTYGLKAVRLEQGDWFLRSGGKFGAGKVFEVTTPILNPKSLTVTIAAFEVDADDSAWDETGAADEATIPGADETALPTVGTPDITVTPFSYTVGSLTYPSARFVNNDATDPLPLGVNIEYALSDGAVTPGPTGEIFNHYLLPGQAQVTLFNLFPSQDYVVRYQAVSGQRAYDWGDWAEFNTTPTFTVAGDVTWASLTGAGKPADYADVTGGNIAAGFTGQGGLATKNNLQYGDAELIGLGSFAALSSLNATLANSNNLLRRSAGGLFSGALNADLTSGNIAAGFTGQGSLATLNQTSTGNIADNATFESLVLLDTTSRAISGSNLYTEIESGVYNKKFAASLVRISWHVKSGKTSTGANFTQVFKLYRGGVAIAEGEFSHWTVPDFNQSWFGSMVVAGVPAGNSTWQLRQRCYTGGSTGVVNVTATYTQFIVEEIKK
jgi:hypothetical protein